MPTASRPRAARPAPPEHHQTDLQALRDHLALLQAEAADLPTAIDDAQRAVDVERWMTLQNRRQDLPRLLHDARVALIPAEADAAWAAVAPLQATEDEARTRVLTAERAVAALNTSKVLYRPRSIPERSAYAVEVHAAAEERRLADRAVLEAQNVVAVALHAVDTLDAEHAQLTGEPLPVSVDRPGPRRLATTVNVGFAHYLDEGTHLPEPLPFSDHASGVFTLTAGTVVPRWHAHLIGEHVFEPTDTEEPA